MPEARARSGAASDASLEAGAPTVTAREEEILRHLEGGLTAKEVARQLGVTVWTVQKHIHHMHRKLNVHNRVSLLNAARQLGILK